MIEDPFDVRRVQAAPPLLRAFNDAGVLAPADVHVALRLAALAGEADEAVVLAAALAVRGPRLGHVYVDLATIAATAMVEDEEPVDLSALPWPDASTWPHAVAASALADGPLHLEGSSLYLDRYWREERRLAADLRAFAEAEPDAVDDARLAAGLARLFGPAERLFVLDEAPDDDQQRAAAAAVLRRLAVVAGGPGTGKTTTVARIVALLAEQDGPAPLVALAAPTGKAAARLEEAVHAEARRLDVDAHVRELLLGLSASTLHRLLGRRPGTHSRFRHDRANRLPHDVVIVDETSMVSLSLMARVVEAVRPTARLILVGDPDQLASIEAGAVLSDVVGPAADGPRMRPRAAARLARVTGRDVAGEGSAAIGDGIVVLRHVYRFGAGIADVAAAVRDGDAERVLDVLAGGPTGVTWLPDSDDPEPLRAPTLAAARAVIRAAEHGDAAAALTALGRFRLLCAHRRGEHGVAAWQERVEAWLAPELAGRWYPGRPLLITANDYGLRLFNGDTGVVVADGERVSAAFERRGEVVHVLPGRLEAVETVHAMTIHKAQGSQFETAAVLLPRPDSPILTRELLYTAVTRASRHLILVGAEAAIRAAVARPVARASGLGDRLWR